MRCPPSQRNKHKQCTYGWFLPRVTAGERREWIPPTARARAWRVGPALPPAPARIALRFRPVFRSWARAVSRCSSRTSFRSSLSVTAWALLPMGGGHDAFRVGSHLLCRSRDQAWQGPLPWPAAAGRRERTRLSYTYEC
jgi:hypothetical protein